MLLFAHTSMPLSGQVKNWVPFCHAAAKETFISLMWRSLHSGEGSQSGMWQPDLFVAILPIEPMALTKKKGAGENVLPPKARNKRPMVQTTMFDFIQPKLKKAA